MRSTKYSRQSSSSENRSNRSSSPFLSEFEYVGRLVTRERPIVHHSYSLHQNLIPRSTGGRYAYSISSKDDAGDLIKPLGVIRINDRHVREIYRIPTPPPEIKRVYHRLRSPKPKIIERVYVRRPTPEIVENIIQVPPEKVQIINTEKQLRPSKPTIRTRVVHLKPHQQQQDNNQQVTTTFDYAPQPNPSSVSYSPASHSPFINAQVIQPTHYTYSSPPMPQNHYSQY